MFYRNKKDIQEKRNQKENGEYGEPRKKTTSTGNTGSTGSARRLTKFEREFSALTNSGKYTLEELKRYQKHGMIHYVDGRVYIGTKTPPTSKKEKIPTRADIVEPINFQIIDFPSAQKQQSGPSPQNQLNFGAGADTNTAFTDDTKAGSNIRKTPIEIYDNTRLVQPAAQVLGSKTTKVEGLSTPIQGVGSNGELLVAQGRLITFVSGSNIKLSTDKSKSSIKVSVHDLNLYELNDVDTTKGLSDGDLLQWDESGTTNAWSFVSVTEALGDAANFAGTNGSVFFESAGLFGNTSDFTYSTAGRQLDVHGISTDGISCSGQLDVRGISSSYYVDIYAPLNGGLPLLELHGQGGLSASHGVKSWYAPIEAYSGISADGISCAGQLDILGGITMYGGITIGNDLELHGSGRIDATNLTLESNGTELGKFRTSGISINGDNTAINTTFRGASDNTLLVVAGASSLDRVGVGTSTPTDKLQVAGNFRSTGGISADGGISAGATSDFNDFGLERTNLKDYSEHVHVVGNVNSSTAFDLENGNIQTVTVAGIDTGSTITFSFTNPPASGKAGTITLIMTNGLAHGDVAWHSSVKWPGDVAPTLSSSGVDIFTFLTIDAGSTWYGFIGGINFS